MPAIHLIERLGNVHCVDKETNEWESGYWAISVETAERLQGGHIYLHQGQKEPSHFGGEVLSFYVYQSEPYVGRIVFRFRAAAEFKGVKTQRAGWSNEKKIVW
jgi:hypothetical protein